MIRAPHTNQIEYRQVGVRTLASETKQKDGDDMCRHRPSKIDLPLLAEFDSHSPPSEGAGFASVVTVGDVAQTPDPVADS